MIAPARIASLRDTLSVPAVLVDGIPCDANLSIFFDLKRSDDGERLGRTAQYDVVPFDVTGITESKRL